MSSTSSTPIFWVGLDVHKHSVSAAVFRDPNPQPLRVDRLPNSLPSSAAGCSATVRRSNEAGVDAAPSECHGTSAPLHQVLWRAIDEGD